MVADYLADLIPIFVDQFYLPFEILQRRSIFMSTNE